ncbi:MAG TPA: ATP-dependent DNA helicase RecG [Solirubrobacterales bacterium]|nr:ATP-dependent DNA helicase RecG [Solirubrobacterales bacterium]
MEAATERDPDPTPLPRAFATGEALVHDALLAAPLKSLPRPSVLEAPVTKLRGAGPKLAAAAAELGISSLGDLLRHIPHSHRDRAEPVGLGELKLGEEGTVQVEVAGSAKLRPTRRRRLTILEADVSDATGRVKAVWFNRAWLSDRLVPGTRMLLRGKLEKRGFTVAEHELLDAGMKRVASRSAGSTLASPAGLHTTGIVPVHPASDRLRPQRIREWVWQALPLARHAVEPLPGTLRAELRIASASDSLAAAHFPIDAHAAEAARERLAFEELFLYQAALVARRGRRLASGRGPELPAPGEWTRAWLDSLPFDLTADQRTAIAEIDSDLAGPQPMQRLLMGEVGSGKTVVALYAMLRAVEAGHQAALMAPTETLAEQHFRTLEALLAEQPVAAALLTSATPGARRRKLLGSLAGGEPQVVVGTHALIESGVDFSSLGVAVVDEQHRFGVRQRAALDAKGPGKRLPHVLHMTATPIPRTLSLTAYGDLDTTSLRALPKGRRPIRTRVVGEDDRGEAYEFIRAKLREGRQAYVVCPLVSESDDARGRDSTARLIARAAEAEARRLAATELRDFRLALLHGQMPSEAKAQAMGCFASGEADVLVATTVIEVGIDVPNATVMLVEGAERFGLSQLHQLRGRVGRGEHESFCILFGDPESDAARARLDAIATESDGFALAEIDLSIRGEGEILGTRQHGLPRFRAATLPEDTALLLEARRRVLALRGKHGSLEDAALGPLMDEARRRFGDERVEQIAL